VQEGQHNFLNLDPLKQQKSTHALQLRDAACRVHFCSWFLQSVVEGEMDPQLIFFSDETRFHLQGYINTQNNRYWSSQNPHRTHVLLHPVKVGVWCAVSARRIVGPVFFKKQLIAKDMYRSFSAISFQS
jgi:hypothetical protein